MRPELAAEEGDTDVQGRGVEGAEKICGVEGGQGPGPWCRELPLGPAPPKVESERAKEFPKRGHAATLGEAGKTEGGPRGLHSRSPPHPPTPRPLVAPAPARRSPYLPRPAPPLTQAVRSGAAAAAGAWEPAAPAGVGLRRRVSPGTDGPQEPGTRKRRRAEVGEGRRRAHALLAGCRAAAGSPHGRGRSQFQGGQKVPGTRSAPPLAGPPGCSARLRALPDTCCAPPARGDTDPRTPPLPDPPGRPRRNLRSPAPGLPAPSAMLRTLRHAPLEKALERQEGLGTRGRPSRYRN
ncbi:collagen alpha-1(I) chain-like [Odocoileus virginianus]|uniref:Collagen alpha-1(I) chain-like n=1 Tax=Odocoileus virginianus TaxID=9874 RepID=A0ABM4IJG1_ODOVR